MADLIDRQAAIETAIEAADKWDGGYSPEREGIIRKFFDKVPAVQPDHVADISKKVEKDCISRQAAINAIKAARIEDDGTYNWRTQRNLDLKFAEEILETVPFAQPDNQINLCDSCDYLYPECPSKIDDLIFGNDIGNDNICACNKYKPSAQPDSKELSPTHKVLDTISRQAAIDCVTYDVEHTIECLKALPSAQPEILACGEGELNVPDTNVGDMISRQAAIDALDEQIEQCNKALCSFDISPKDEYAIKVERASLEAYKEQLENMPSAQSEQRWIPVTERLTENDNEVLITVWDAEDDYVEVYKGFYQGHEWWTQWCHGCSKIKDEPCGENIVIAWMPLPAPYRGGEQDDR